MTDGFFFFFSSPENLLLYCLLASLSPCVIYEDYILFNGG